MLLKCKIMMNAAKKNFYTSFIAKNSTDQGKLFRAAKKLLAKKEVPSFPGYADKSVLLNDMGNFFIRKIESIRSDIDKAVNSRSKHGLNGGSTGWPRKSTAYLPSSK